MNKSIEESVLSKLRKIQAYAERGQSGEADAARRLLEEQLRKYGLTLEDIADEVLKMRRFKYSNISERKLLGGVVLRCLGRKSRVWKEARINKRGKYIFCEMTDLEYAELAPMWEYYRTSFARELRKTEENFLIAFRVKFDLFDDTPDDTADDASQPEDKMSREEIMRILGLAQSISVDPFVRLLND